MVLSTVLKDLMLTVLLRVVGFTLGLICAAIYSLRIGYDWFMKGANYWKVKERSLPPLCLQDAQYGRHAYIRLKVCLFNKFETNCVPPVIRVIV
jgi:hypothetical protein